jgi:two-component system NtrC family sensor kinase
MKKRTLKNQILASFAIVIAVLSVSTFALGFYIVKTDVFERIQTEVERSLKGARTVYEEEIRRIGVSFEIADLNKDPRVLREKMHLHYFYRIPYAQAIEHPSEIVSFAAQHGRSIGGTRVIGPDELATMDPEIRRRAHIEIKPTVLARPTNKTSLDSAMAKEYAMPLTDSDGHVEAVVFGGRIINQDYEFVDHIRQLVFGGDEYRGLPVGTVTIFLDDVRISTNVLDENSRRAVGTRVSEVVYNEVFGHGRPWLDRAIVVGHWYMSAYEPIVNINDQIIGILYVGILEEPFHHRAANLLLAFLAMILVASIVAFVLAYILAESVSRPLTLLLEGTQKLSRGEVGHLIKLPQSSVKEIHQLAQSFNEMSVRLEEREVRLQENHQKLEELNKSYLDLLGFVAHELKGLLSSTMLNAYALRDGFLGMINFKQKKAVDSICRNLDYLAATVTKFLNLSRIERGNLEVNKTRFSLWKDVFAHSVQTFSKLINDKNMKVINQIDPELTVIADPDLMLIVANNLINNAAKYGTEGGQIILSARAEGPMVTVEVYNDGRPISEQERAMLFRKFSRLNTPEKKKVKGTGLGLYITKQIIESHGGHIEVQAKENGNSFIFQIPKE